MSRPTHTILRLLALAALVPTLLAVSATAVRADPIPRIQGPVTDLTGALSGREGEVEDAIERTLDEHNLQVFVVFVNSTDDMTVTEYVDETARVNSLGGNDALVLVAMDDRTDAIWVADGLDAITDDEIDDVIVNELESRLADGDFAGAAIAAVETLGEASATATEPPPAVTAPPAATARPAPSPAAEPESGGAGLGTIIVAVALLGGGGFLVYRAVRGRREADQAEQRRQQDLSREANAGLIAIDERIRDAVQEIGFVEAQFGPEETGPLHGAVAAARNELKAAFEIRQRLDDAEPEDPPARQAMLAEIVERTKRANALLDEQAERIRRLHEIERDAPQILASLPDRFAAIEARLPRAEEALAGLGRYATSAWQAVRGNVEEARKGLAGARASADEATAALARSESAAAASDVRIALEGVTGAERLLDGIDRLVATIAAAEDRVPLELREAEADLADARSSRRSGTTAPGASAGGDLETRLAAAERALAAARQEAAMRPADPVAALQAATEAHRLADEALLAAQEQAQAHARVVAAAESQVRTAAASIDRAADFIESRRRGVGRRARTRLAEAERNLNDATALQATDPKLALEAAGRAQRLADEAYRLAADDFNDWDQGGPGWGQRRGGESDLAGAVLGGIIGGILSGGGSGGGGWGGSPWGGGGRGGGFPGWGGGGFGGGFGGGGGLGGLGGGGRSRGGRW